MRMSLQTAAAISGVRPGASAARRFGGGVVGEQPVAEFADGEMSDRRRRLLASWRVDDEAGDFVGLVGDERFVEEVCEREVGEGELGGDALAAVRAAMPARSSPERGGVALARRSLRLGKV